MREVVAEYDARNAMENGENTTERGGGNAFYHMLLRRLSENWNNDFSDNFDFGIFGTPERMVVDPRESLKEIELYLDNLQSMYSLLDDERSRDLFLQLLAFRILGHRKVRLPLSHRLYFEAIDKLSRLVDTENNTQVRFLDRTKLLYQADLTPVNLPIKIFTTPMTILTQFLLKQYEYTTDEMMIIGAQPGDVVIDGGACWGDVALFFANRVGKSGKVYSFEFIPGNLDIFSINMGLNPSLGGNVELIAQPLWSESGVRTYYRDTGPASNVTLAKFDGCDGVVDTITIDDLVSMERLKRVDFIKMDIEGAEQYALNGARETLQEFTPKLAITVYHSMNDFSNIIHVINDMNLGYKFYLGHFTIYHGETVLFAIKP